MDEAAAAKAHPYSRLTPDRVLDALETVDLRGDGRLLALNSYENRVYQVWLEDEAPVGERGQPAGVVVVKFYRPERWTTAQIEEEHAFAVELEDEPEGGVHRGVLGPEVENPAVAGVDVLLEVLGILDVDVEAFVGLEGVRHGGPLSILPGGRWSEPTIGVG